MMNNEGLIELYNQLTNTDQGHNLVTYFTKYGLDGEVLEWAVKLVADAEVDPVFVMNQYKKYGEVFPLYCKESGKEVPSITINKSYRDLCFANDKAWHYLVTHGLIEDKVTYSIIPYDDIILTEKIFPIP